MQGGAGDLRDSPVLHIAGSADFARDAVFGLASRAADVATLCVGARAVQCLEHLTSSGVRRFSQRMWSLPLSPRLSSLSPS